jgi:hypothetical protein
MDAGESMPSIVCKHWQHRGFCLFKESCLYPHPPEALAAVAQRAAERAALPACLHTTNLARPRGPGGYAGRRKVRNAFRAGAFRRFLLDTFGREALGAGEGVLDVAGGKGEVAFELLNLNGIAATVLEPRDLDLRRAALQLERGYYHWNPLYALSNDAPRHADAPALMPAHLRMAVTPEVARCVARTGGLAAGAAMPADWPAAFAGAVQAARDPGWADRAAGHESAAPGRREAPPSARVPPAAAPPGERAAAAAAPPARVDDAAAAWRAVSGCSVVVGMHPDQATDFVVDLALAHGKPFAVVPCCVHAKEFPLRRTPAGAPVRSYDDLIAHLVAKAPGIEAAALPFEGQHTCVFRRHGGPAAPELRDPTA